MNILCNIHYSLSGLVLYRPGHTLYPNIKFMIFHFSKNYQTYTAACSRVYVHAVYLTTLWLTNNQSVNTVLSPLWDK